MLNSHLNSAIQMSSEDKSTGAKTSSVDGFTLVHIVGTDVATIHRFNLAHSKDHNIMTLPAHKLDQ